MWQQDPRGFWEVLSASGSFRKLEIWILFSARDPNSRSNVGNCFGVELFNKTSSSIKFGTSRTERMPRVWFHPWRKTNFSENLEKWRFSDPQRSSLCHTTATAFANKKGQNQRKIGVPWRKSDIPRWRMTAARLGKSWSYLGNSKLGNSTTEKYIRHLGSYAMQKAYLPMHGSAWQFRELRLLPKFLFRDRSTSSLDTWRGLIHRVIRKIFGAIRPKAHELWISEVPHYKPMGKAPWREEVLTLRCLRQLWKFYKGENFSIFQLWV